MWSDSDEMWTTYHDYQSLEIPSIYSVLEGVCVLEDVCVRESVKLKR